MKTCLNILNEKNLVYIADFSLPNMSAYSLHVLKMCDAFSELGYFVKLILPHKEKSYRISRIKNDFLLKKNLK